MVQRDVHRAEPRLGDLSSSILKEQTHGLVEALKHIQMHINTESGSRFLAGVHQGVMNPSLNNGSYYLKSEALNSDAFSSPDTEFQSCNTLNGEARN